MTQNIQEQVKRSAHERWISTGLAGRLMRLCPNLFPDLQSAGEWVNEQTGTAIGGMGGTRLMLLLRDHELRRMVEDQHACALTCPIRSDQSVIAASKSARAPVETPAPSTAVPDGAGG